MREEAQADKKVKDDAEREAHRLKIELEEKKQLVTMSSPTTRLVFDPNQGEEIPQWSRYGIHEAKHTTGRQLH